MLLRALVALTYLFVLVAFAYWARRRTHDIEDYYVGGRNMPTVLVVLSFFATFVSTNSFIGHSAKSYVFGVSWLIVGLILLLLTVASWWLIAPRFVERTQALGSVTPSDLFRLHYRSTGAGALAAAIVIFDSIVFLAAVFIGAAEAMGALLTMPFAAALVVVFIVQVTYTAVGGYMSDVWSDAVQAFILLIGVFAIPIALVTATGGWTVTWNELQLMDEARMNVQRQPFPLTRITMQAPLVLLIGIGLSGGLKLVADPRQLSRFYGLRDTGAARRGMWLTALVVGVTYFLLLPIGLLARAYGVPADIAGNTDQIVPWLLAEAQIVGPFLGAVLLTALLAAAMSTIDSVLLVAAGAWQRDLLPLVSGRADTNSLKGARRIVFALAVAAVGLAALARAFPAANLGIVELTVLAGALYAAAFLPGLIGILYWKQASHIGAILAMILGVAATSLWRFGVMHWYPDMAAVPEVFIGIAAGVTGLIIGSLLTHRR
jgi:Na+/pantothenate symporter